MKYILIYHANLNYSYLTQENYESVIRQSYELIIDTMKQEFPDTKYVFEASGFTIEQIARRTPDVLDKLKDAINSGQCEFMGSPYAHPILPNIPREDGLWTIRFSNDVYKKYLDLQPVSFWNPECGWRDYIPLQVRDSGYKNLIGDFEAYSRSRWLDGKPLRPEIFERENRQEKKFYDFGFNYDLPGEERAIHFPFRMNPDAGDDLRIFLRTDRVCQFGVRYFMGMKGYSLQKYMDLIDKYSGQKEDEPEGALIIFADDAEYIGTNGWFLLKYQNKPDNVFEFTPESKSRLIDFIQASKQRGEFVTFNHACNEIPVLKEPINFDDDSAWHGAKASTWANTPMARLLGPWQRLVREKLKSIEDTLTPAQLKRAWFHLTNSYNSDGQWPPTLPESAHIVHPFNYKYCFKELIKAERIVNGVDRNRLKTDPANTLHEILSIQQNLVLNKAELLKGSPDEQKKRSGEKAADLIKKSKDYRQITEGKCKILDPAEYRIRAESLVKARKIVGGVVIEKQEV